MPPISGTWRRSPRSAWVDRKGGHERNWGVLADPDHGRTDIPDPGYPPPAIPPVRVWTPPYLEDFWDPERETLPYLPPVDQEPAGHDVPMPPNGGVRDRLADAQANAARSQYRGADTSRGRPIVARQWDQTHASPLMTSLPPTPQGADGELSGQALRALRGRNSLPVNNPGSPEINFSGNYTRQGQELYRWTDRKMPYNAITPTLRPLMPNLAAAPRMTAPANSPYTSYVVGGAGLTSGQGPQTPYMRREPRPWDESAVRDGTTDLDVPGEFVSWGM